MRDPAAECHQGLAAALVLIDTRDQFINRFIDDKDKNRRRIKAEIKKIQLVMSRE